MSTKRRLEVVADLEAVSRAALDRLKVLLKGTGRVRMALSGGSTPRRMYQLMAEAGLPWERLELFWGDERYVPHDHPDSNYKMVREALLDRVPLPPAQVHPWPILESATASADAYQTELSQVFGGVDKVGFDLVLLGMGDDGHTASLFPGTPALAVTDRVAVANHVEKMQSWRLTLTYPVLARSRQVLFLIAGASKAEPLAQVWAGADLPSAHVQAAGELVFLVDQAAAAKLPPDALPQPTSPPSGSKSDRLR